VCVCVCVFVCNSRDQGVNTESQVDISLQGGEKLEKKEVGGVKLGSMR